MELLQYWKIIRKRLLMIILFVLVAVLGALFYIRQQVPMYRTSTTLFISPSTLGSVLSYQLVYAVGPLANTYSEYMKTTTFGKLVADHLDVQISTGEVLKALSAEYVANTQIFRITATYRNPEVAQKLANTTAQMLIQANTQRQRSQLQAKLSAQTSSQSDLRLQQMGDLVSVLQDQLKYYDDVVKRLDAQVNVLQQGPESGETTQQILDLRKQVIDARSQRVTVLSSLAQSQTALVNATKDSQQADVDTAVVIDPAPLPKAPVSGNALQPLVAAIMAALALGVGLAWFLEYLDYTIKTPEDLDDLYGVPTQGAIGFVTGAGGPDKQRADSLVVLTEPRSSVAEAFRSLRTSIRMAGATAPIRSLLVTSAGPGEGKTFVASNIAVSFAQEGRRVLLVDLDLRRPQVHTIFQQRREPGFTNLVVDRERTLADCIQPTSVPNLSILTCGTVPPHPAELLGSPRAAEVMQQLYNEVDLVIYDSAPAATVTDSILIAPQVDGVLQVVLAGGTRIDMVRRCKVLLERAGARILGPVLNRVQSGDLGYYANYYYYGGYYHDGEQRRSSGWRGIFAGNKQNGNDADSGARANGRGTKTENGQWTLVKKRKADNGE